MQGGMAMRITRAYTITPEVKRILDTKPNKSEYICRAVRKMHLQEDELVLRDIPMVDIMRHIIARSQCPQHIRAVIVAWMDES
jgi:hypothetical protein